MYIYEVLTDVKRQPKFMNLINTFHEVFIEKVI